MNDIEKVKAAEVNKTIELDSPHYDNVKFDTSNYGDGYKFSWSAHKRGRSDYWQWAHPLGRTSSTVGVFKTLAGAKRNFIKRLEGVK